MELKYKYFILINTSLLLTKLPPHSKGAILLSYQMNYYLEPRLRIE